MLGSDVTHGTLVNESRSAAVSFAYRKRYRDLMTVLDACWKDLVESKPNCRVRMNEPQKHSVAYDF